MTVNFTNKTIKLCQVEAIPPLSARGFAIMADTIPSKLFVVNDGRAFYAYENCCPHTGVNLDWQENQFLDTDKTFIQCATHGALFRIEDGLCIYGPCVNRSLTSVEIQINGDELFVPAGARRSQSD